MKPTLLTASFLAIALMLGCNQTKQPTYAEAVQLYEAEMAELERLEARQAQLQAAQKAGDVAIDLDALSRELVGNIGQMQLELGEATTGLLDDSALAGNDKAKEQLKQLEERLKQQGEADSAREAELQAEAEKLKATAEKELPELQVKIDKQKERVEAARKAKEALAPKS